MKPHIFSLRLCVLVIVAVFSLLLISCKEPQDEADVPVQEWTVTSVVFFSLYDPPYFYVETDHSLSGGGNYYYSKDFKHKITLYPYELLTVPGLTLRSGYNNGNGVVVHADPGTTIPDGTAATFYSDWFYQSTSDMYGDTTITAKIKIITTSIVINVIK